MPQYVPRRRFLAAAASISLAGCVGASPESNSTPTAQPAGTTSPTSTSAGTTGDDALPLAETPLPLPMSPEELANHAISGGPPKDGIPSIDDPSFEAAAEVGNRLDPGDIVFGVERDGEAKAYPQYILVWHEIVNDTIAGDAVSVTYCPLTGTVQGFDRGETTLGVSGRLINNNLVMYDRATERWWPQVPATSIPSPWSDLPTGDSLREFRAIWTTWDRWSRTYPTTKVLTEDTGYARGYNRDPYGSYNPRGGYYEDRNTLFQRLNPDDRYHPKGVFMGARTPDGAVAFLKDSLRADGVMEGSLGGKPVIAVYDPDLDTAYVYRNPGETVFEYDDGSVVSANGAYDASGLPLDHIVTFDAMWFAWSGYYPETTVYE